ncbi:hypothetical protein FB451DRAFT_1489162 [Mycena latifolia]|nr:hypothetical protein FB451DRAFT_1489162 [Mycena latifolia]
MELCKGSDAFDLGSPCVRGLWSAALPTFVVLVFLVSSIVRRLFPDSVRRAISKPFAPYMTVEEAQAPDFPVPGHPLVRYDGVDSTTGRRHSLFFAVLGLLEVFLWGGQAILSLISGNLIDPQSILLALAWLYTVPKAIVSPCATVPSELLAIYVLHGMGGMLILGGYLFDYVAEKTGFPSQLLMMGLCANTIIVLSVLCAAAHLPINMPPPGVPTAEILSLLFPG